MKKTALICLALTMMLSGCTSVNANNVNNVSTNTQQESTKQENKKQYIMAGKIQANSEANISSKISGKVSEISVDVGSKVNEGDTIIQLDTTDLQAQVDQAKAALNTANANLNNAASGTRPEQIAQEQAALDGATKSYEIIQKNYDRIKTLLDAGAATQQELDTAEQQLSAAETQKKAAQDQLDMLKNGATQASIDVYKAQVGQAEAALKVVETALDNATIKAPISGTVSAKNINVGELATPGATLVSVVNDSGLCVNAYAPLDIVNDLKEDQSVIVKVDQVPDKEFEGKISVINPKLNSQSNNILVKVSLDDPDSLLKPGMFAEIGLNN